MHPKIVAQVTIYKLKVMDRKNKKILRKIAILIVAALSGDYLLSDTVVCLAETQSVLESELSRASLNANADSFSLGKQPVLEKEWEEAYQGANNINGNSSLYYGWRERSNVNLNSSYSNSLPYCTREQMMAGTVKVNCMPWNYDENPNPPAVNGWNYSNFNSNSNDKKSGGGGGGENSTNLALAIGIPVALLALVIMSRLQHKTEKKGQGAKDSDKPSGGT